MINSTKPLANRTKPRIVILGAGFGGLYTFLELRKIFSAKQADITIINRTNYFLFTPLLHEVATGGLAHHQVVESIRGVMHKKGGTLHVAEVNRIDSEKKVVETTVGAVEYDYLVIATGASTAFYGTPGAAEHSMVLKDLRDAIKVRNQLINAFEMAIETKDSAERKRLLTFVLVGGGATGVELATEMTDLFYETLEKFFCGKIDQCEVNIQLVSSDPVLLKVFHPSVQKRALKILNKRGVSVRLGAQVKAVDGDGVVLADGSRIDSENVFWLAGVQPNTPEAGGAFLLAPNKRIVVDENLRVKMAAASAGSTLSGVYALGDVATFETKPIPMLAQVAVQQAPVVARNLAKEIRASRSGSEAISAKLQKYSYHSKGELVSLGQWQAAGYVYGITWVGPLAWFIWRTVYLSKFASWPKRIKIALDWTIDLFYPRDITRA